MESHRPAICKEDVERYPLSKNLSTETLFGTTTGSTVGRDVNSSAASRVFRPRQPDEDTNDDGSTEFEYDEQDRHASGRVMSDLKPTTENAYGGGLYGFDQVPSPRQVGTASDFQSAEGLASDMPKHKDVKMHSTGDRDVDITGQSYIQ